MPAKNKALIGPNPRVYSNRTTKPIFFFSLNFPENPFAFSPSSSSSSSKSSSLSATTPFVSIHFQLVFFAAMELDRLGYCVDDTSLLLPSVLEALTVETLLTAANSLAWFFTTVSPSFHLFLWWVLFVFVSTACLSWFLLLLARILVVLCIFLLTLFISFPPFTCVCSLLTFCIWLWLLVCFLYPHSLVVIATDVKF